MDGMTWMASAMRAAQAQLDSAAHNLANVASDGFRRTRAAVSLGSGGLVVRTEPTTEQGGIRETNRSFDLALVGPGAFRTGNVRTRDGAFVCDRDGFLADGAGRRVLGEAGPIRLTTGATFAADGTIRDGDRIAGRIPLPRGTTLRSGALEASNVDAIGETLAILTSQRAFETAQKTFVAIDETREKAVNDVVRLK